MKIFTGISSSLRVLFSAFFLIYPSLSIADFHGTLTGTTNNAYRWFSKSDNNVALLANLDYEHTSGFYAGSSVSNIDFEDNEIKSEAAHVEIMPYAGWSFSLPKRFRLDLQWSGYIYDGNVFGHNADYHEFYLLLHYQDFFTGRISVAPDYYGLNNYAIDYSLTGRYPITDALQFSASFGYAQTQTILGSDYPYWDIGLAYSYKFVTLALRYMDSAETFIDPVNSDKMHELYDPPLLDAACVFSISVGF